MNTKTISRHSRSVDLGKYSPLVFRYESEVMKIDDDLTHYTHIQIGFVVSGRKNPVFETINLDQTKELAVELLQAIQHIEEDARFVPSKDAAGSAMPDSKTDLTEFRNRQPSLSDAKEANGGSDE